MAQAMAPGSGAWEDLRKQARKLENEIDMKLMSFSKLGAGHSSSSLKSDSGDSEPLLSTEDIFETVALEVEQLLAKLTSVNERLAEVFGPEGTSASSNAALIHTLQRHREILQDYKQEFHKTKTNWRARREREDLLRSVRKDIDTFKTSSGLNRRMDLYLKENDHIRSSDRLVDEQISIAVDTRDNLMSQRFNLKRIQTRVHDLSSRFPAVNSLLQRINMRKRRDSLILGAIVGCCTILMLLYAFH